MVQAELERTHYKCRVVSQSWSLLADLVPRVVLEYILHKCNSVQDLAWQYRVSGHFGMLKAREDSCLMDWAKHTLMTGSLNCSSCLFF